MCLEWEYMLKETQFWDTKLKFSTGHYHYIALKQYVPRNIYGEWYVTGNFIASSINCILFATVNCKFMLQSSFTQQAWNFMREMPNRMIRYYIQFKLSLWWLCIVIKWHWVWIKTILLPRYGLNLMQNRVEILIASSELSMWCHYINRKLSSLKTYFTHHMQFSDMHVASIFEK